MFVRSTKMATVYLITYTYIRPIVKCANQILRNLKIRLSNNITFTLYIEAVKIIRGINYFAQHTFNICISRLNSRIKNRNNFFAWVFFSYKKIGSDSVNQADSGDIKILVQFPGNSILKFFTNFWKCVGGAHMRGCWTLKITQCVYPITTVIFIFTTKGTYLILP